MAVLFHMLSAEMLGWLCCAVLSRFSYVWLFVTLWTVAHQAPLSMGFSRQEYWNGLPCPPPGHLLDPGIHTVSLKSPALAGRLFTTSATWEALQKQKARISSKLWFPRSGKSGEGQDLDRAEKGNRKNLPQDRIIRGRIQKCWLSTFVAFE